MVEHLGKAGRPIRPSPPCHAMPRTSLRAHCCNGLVKAGEKLCTGLGGTRAKELVQAESEQGQVLGVFPLPADQVEPEAVRLLDHIQGKGPVLGLVVEAKGIGGFAVRDLVVPEPLVYLLQLAGELAVTGVRDGLGICREQGFTLGLAVGRWPAPRMHAGPAKLMQGKCRTRTWSTTDNKLLPSPLTARRPRCH